MPSEVRNRPGRAVIVTLLVVELASLVAVLNRSRTINGNGAEFANRPYFPQVLRNAEWDGQPQGPFTNATSREIVTNDSYEVLPKFADNYNIRAHFVDVRRMASMARSVRNPIRIFDYFNASYWFTRNDQGWLPYSRTFQPSWYLRNYEDRPIPFFDVGHSESDGIIPAGYVLDLANPNYREWAVKTIVGWMKAAPYAGIAFDSADPMIGRLRRANVGARPSTLNTILCGPSYSGPQNCPAVRKWNNGLASLIAETTTALHKIGDEVAYNGVASSAQRGPTRNLDLLGDADIAVNENFCYDASIKRSIYIPESLSADITMMRSVAVHHKKIFEITNYETTAKEKHADFCLAGFLMGWQPGSSYWVYHKNYQDPLAPPYPRADKNLALGLPMTSGFETTESVLSRRFQYGYVAINIGNHPESVQVPEDILEFVNGKPVQEYNANTMVTIEPRSQLLALTIDYLYNRQSR